MLILFDIDGTLLTSMRAGVEAMTSAGRACVHGDFTLEGMDVAGRLDSHIMGEALAAVGAGAHHLTSLVETYAAHLDALLSASDRAAALPGVHALLEAIEARPQWTLGLLTGNIAPTGRIKLRHAGIDPDRFKVQVWGDEGPTRNCLPQIALRRCADSSPQTTVIIGDTHHDIACARAHGCRVIAVATGPLGRDDLACGQPDLLLDDLLDTGTVVAWLERMSV